MDSYKPEGSFFRNCRREIGGLVARGGRACQPVASTMVDVVNYG
ncbi:hypothetical protein [Desulfocastanea catecholica]